MMTGNFDGADGQPAGIETAAPTGSKFASVSPFENSTNSGVGVLLQNMVKKSLVDLKERLGRVRREKDAMEKSLFMYD